MDRSGESSSHKESAPASASGSSERAARFVGAAPPSVRRYGGIQAKAAPSILSGSAAGAEAVPDTHDWLNDPLMAAAHGVLGATRGAAASAAPVQRKAVQRQEPTPGRCELPAREIDPGAAAPTTLTNRRFAGDTTLEAIINGTATMRKGARGPSVRRVQAALEDLGHPLPEYHADGGFGDETKAAVESFQRSEGLADVSGVIDQATMQRLDQRAPEASAAVHAWREAEVHDAGQPAQTRLTNPRFVGDPMLEMLMSGMGAMRRGARGVYVWKVQVALRDLGFFGDERPNGSFGRGTKAAVEAFQAAYNVPSQPPSGETYTEAREEKGAVNGATMAALDAYSPRTLPTDAPSARLSEGHSPDYAALFADGKLEITLAIGYDDNSNHHIVKKAQAIAYLQNELDFTMTDPRVAAADEVRAAGLDPAALHRELLYFTRTITPPATGQQAQVIVKLLTPAPDGSDGAARRDRFRAAMESDDAVLYTGHARAGTGPDFDPHESSEGNYVMGRGYSSQYNREIAGADNQLEATNFDERYQIYQIWGCTTENYWKHMKKRLGERGADGQRLRSHKDIVLTNAAIPTVRGLFGTLAFLRGLIAGANTQTLTDMTDSAMRMDVTETHGME